MPRLFFGLEIPESIKTSVLTVKTDINGARWQSEAQLHLTLAFLGEVERWWNACQCLPTFPNESIG